MDKITFLIERAEEGGFNARAINQSIFTQAETLALLEINIADAIECHFDDIRPGFELKLVDL
ncbi:2-oxoisovalerate dehydrogenase [Mucilaginibacter sp. FT3.2]|uniref:2-oxoisovalerate dehydrogenase n=1 Tax=Mucilaginibacter sp. FT3.2 TaxID=2723090 RepID=UPI0016113151|nr:2-oxoisovalerate dehydrogenase [Mucilaginibacter sp. FT3.2]MBB6235309.1 putative RNase H-like HicB family nuclease [Mucilaginibacter sp. FT3.2]